MIFSNGTVQRNMRNQNNFERRQVHSVFNGTKTANMNLVSNDVKQLKGFYLRLLKLSLRHSRALPMRFK